ncbi:BglG family transcription antiterminator [Paenactinomyces guangxiensis]|uniref:Transcription antiterminator n=1 Tax=Paenactinomyces guangxiensis TaxID=1490290 RepID=A0A7W1WQ22_9BACL|nr:BglG family transcription antiterminator [Paenactinomyces guangxiensis]MBA4493977.1 transcription antiterminator [Paenactinomyces guangxiensis]MBH8593398.1 transcription antiterminator [Paenactinomyces guangxiensis]
MLSSRQLELLRILMQSEKEVTSHKLANIFQITSRTVRNDIKEISEALLKNGAKIVALRGKGYQLEILDYNSFRSFLQEIALSYSKMEAVPTEPKERVNYIIKRLLLSEGYIKLETLAEELFVSESTIKNDLKEVRSIMSNYELELDKRPNYGLKITGNEIKLRYCMAEHVFNSSHKAPSLLPDDELEAIRSIILKHTNAAGIQLSDIGVNNLVIHIAIACKRVLSQNYVSIYEEDLHHIMNQKEYQVSERIVNDIKCSLNVPFPDAEIAYITIHLLGTKTIAYRSREDASLSALIDHDIYSLTQKLLAEVERYLNLGIQNDKELIFGLSLHLKPAINRHYYQMNIRNPLLAEIKQKYPIAFDAGVIMGKTLDNILGISINEDEIGYLALHVEAALERIRSKSGSKRCVIVCATGVASSQLLYYKLKATFGSRLDIIDTLNAHDLQNYPLDTLDFVISTIPIKTPLSIPVIDVNTIITGQDIHRIENMLIEDVDGILQYIEPEWVFLKQELKSKEEVINFLTQKLEELDMIPENFKEALLERENISPTSFGNLVAIPHPMSRMTDKTFWSVCTLNKPILWGENRVQFVCLLSVQKEYKDDLQKMYRFLVKIVEDATLVDQLLKVDNYSEFIQVLKTHGNN